MGFDKKCIDTIESVCSSPGLTTSTALLEAFNKLGVNRAAVITPYPDNTNEIEASFLESAGINVTTIKGMTYSEKEIFPIQPALVYQAVKKLDLTGADCIFISCTGLNILDLIDICETDFGLPVLTSNQVSLWGSMRHSRIGTKIPYLGKLFTL